MNIKPIAYIRTDFPEKFGVPRQSGLAKSVTGRIIFEKEYRNSDALRGLEEFSHLWLIWEFSENRETSKEWRPMVRPPRLGGNMNMGVFATRSPFRPNPLGLSCVGLVSIDLSSPDAPVIIVAGADLVDGTPIYDIKPYIKYSDSYPEAVCGYVDKLTESSLEVVFPDELKEIINDDPIINSLIEVLQLDPRPSYHTDSNREYGVSFAGYNVRFKVNDNCLEVVGVSLL